VRPRAPKPPNGLANEYARYLRTRIEHFARVDILEGWDHNPVHYTGRMRADASTFVNKAIAKLVRVVDDNPVPQARLQALATQVDRRNKRVVGVPTSQHAPGAPIAMFRERNLELITKLDQKMIDELRTVLEAAESNALPVEALRAEIQERFDVTKSHADLIARDQVLKLNGQITEFRQTSAGVTQYEWSTSSDERVRPDHDELDGTVQDWASPPISNQRTGDRNHPGQDIQCRCVAIPII
jgi:SPP1 gp7 family putative phage head morphogenesis protein